MVFGVRAGLVEIRRTGRTYKKNYFMVCTSMDMGNQQAEGSASKLANFFAVKEAVVKAPGMGFRTSMPIDMKVLRDDVGKPYTRLYRGTLARLQEVGMECLKIPVTNTRGYATAFAMGEGKIEEVQSYKDTGNGETDESH